MNTYRNIARHYDLLMTSGYYDYEALSEDLQQVVDQDDRVLELGVGTGLIAERLLSDCPDINFTGIDITEGMLEQAKTRLGEQASLHLADVGTFEADEPYDVVFSCGGVWYLIDDEEEDEFQLCSHIPDSDISRQAFANVMQMLRPGGSLLLSIQGVHRDFDQQLDDDVVYRQRIRWDGDIFHKEYIFEAGEENLVQHCTYRILRKPEMEKFFGAANLQMADSPLRQFVLFENVADHDDCSSSRSERTIA